MAMHAVQSPFTTLRTPSTPLAERHTCCIEAPTAGKHEEAKVVQINDQALSYPPLTGTTSNPGALESACHNITMESNISFFFFPPRTERQPQVSNYAQG